MCTYLIDISRHIGQAKSESIILPEIKELLEDEEGEVTTEAFIQYQKHIATVFSLEFVKSQENLEMFYKFCDSIQIQEFQGIDVAVVLKKLAKVLVTLDRPQDTEFTNILQQLLSKIISTNHDEEVRAMIPCTFEGLVYLYRAEVPVLVNMYDKLFSNFISAEIKKGRSDSKDDSEDSVVNTSSKSSFCDTFEYETNQKKSREDCNDLNYLVNRSIAQNLHYFFGAFVQVFNYQANGTAKQLQESKHSPLVKSSPLLKQLKESSTTLMKSQSKHVLSSKTSEVDKVRHCIVSILENFRLLLQTKD